MVLWFLWMLSWNIQFIHHHTFITIVLLCEISECPSQMVVVWRTWWWWSPHEHEKVHWLTFTQNQFHEFLIWFDTLPLPPSAPPGLLSNNKTKCVYFPKHYQTLFLFFWSIHSIFLFYLSWWTKDDINWLIKLLKT